MTSGLPFLFVSQNNSLPASVNNKFGLESNLIYKSGQVDFHFDDLLAFGAGTTFFDYKLYDDGVLIMINNC